MSGATAELGVASSVEPPRHRGDAVAYERSLDLGSNGLSAGEAPGESACRISSAAPSQPRAGKRSMPRERCFGTHLEHAGPREEADADDRAARGVRGVFRGPRDASVPRRGNAAPRPLSVRYLDNGQSVRSEDSMRVR